MDTQNRSLFISSCTRRQAARRRPTRAVSPAQLLLAVLVVALALGAFVVVHGGL
jgi:hypothetical protein